MPLVIDSAFEFRHPNFHYNTLVADFSADRSLILFLFLNTAVFASAFLFARRRMNCCLSQALLDAALIGYAVQYIAIGLPGSLGCLHAPHVYATAGVLCAGLFFAAITAPSRSLRPAEEPGRVSYLARTATIGVALFVISFIILYVHTRAAEPVMSNDAMTYHFPAAVQWLQHGKIDLFQTWFFNPANTYSPLAGSIFIAWLMIPFSSDVLARFVEVPALLCVGLAVNRLCREVAEAGRAGPAPVQFRGDAPRLCSAMLAAAAVCARPIFLPCLMGKDDLFVAFFFIASLVALSPARAKDSFGPIRFGIALGLLLATKYTALLCAPLLLLAIDAPRWCVRRWIASITMALLLAGPWYLRNWLHNGNPLYPLDIPPFFRGLFSTSHSAAFASFHSAFSAVAGGSYGMPLALVGLLVFGWIAGLTFFRVAWSRPILRTCIVGSAIGAGIFFWRSPFPEVRFLLPIFLMMFATLSAGIHLIGRHRTATNAAAALVLILSVVTLLDCSFWRVTLMLSGFSLGIAAVGLLILWWAGSRWMRWIFVGSLCAAACFIFAFINWTAYTVAQSPDAFYEIEYPEHAPLWRAVSKSVPAHATVAYTNLYLIYPLMGRSLSRRLVCVPTRAGVSSIADLGWLGSNLSGEQLIPAAVRATVAAPNRATWIENLRQSGAGYLVIGRGGVVNVPPDAGFVAGDQHFKLMFHGPAGWLYQID